MQLSIGIVGLPNVGKSTLFNLLTNNNIPAENYPFCTIDPNVGIVTVPDERIDKIAGIVKPKKVVPAVIEFYDIAGLVKGAHTGEGLGNAFLANIRSVSAIVHVVRAFEDTNVIHVNNKIDPRDDKETIELELILKDLETVSKSIEKIEKEVRRDIKNKKFMDHLVEIKKVLEENKLANQLEPSTDIEVVAFRKNLTLLTDKPVIFLLNGNWSQVDEKLYEEWSAKLDVSSDANIVFMNIKEEFELSQLSEEERIEYSETFGIAYQGLNSLIKSAYAKLGLISFFTAGEQEVRAWTIKKGEKAPEAAGAIHSDFQNKFITAEVVSYDDFITCQGWAGARTGGKFRLEGKEYVVADGDVMVFRHGA